MNIKSHMVCYVIWYHLYNLKKVKNTHERVLLLVKLQAKPGTLLKVTLRHGFFSRFLNCTNGTESRKASYIGFVLKQLIPNFLPFVCPY